MTDINYYTIATDSYLDMWRQYDQLVAQGYTRSEFYYYVAPESGTKPLFVISMLPPTEVECP